MNSHASSTSQDEGPAPRADAASEAAHRLDTRRGGGNEVRKLLLPGAPATALVEAASDCDLLVIGARGLGTLKSALLGSTSNQAIHHARCPIAVIHTAHPD